MSDQRVEATQSDDEAPILQGDEAPIDRQKLPVLVKLFGILCLLGGVATLPMVALVPSSSSVCSKKGRSTTRP